MSERRDVVNTSVSRYLPFTRAEWVRLHADRRRDRRPKPAAERDRDHVASALRFPWGVAHGAVRSSLRQDIPMLV